MRCAAALVVAVRQHVQDFATASAGVMKPKISSTASVGDRALCSSNSRRSDPWNFHSNPKCFFTATQWFIGLIRATTAGGWASVTVPALNVRANQNRRRIVVPRSLRSRRHELRAKTARLVVVLSLFLMLITAAVFIGGRSVIGPMLEKAMARAGDTHRKGAIVFTMPDGTFCRHLAFDNKTAELTESTVLQCPEARPREAAHPPSGFAWEAH